MFSGLPQKADIAQCSRHVSEVPWRDSCTAAKSSFIQSPRRHVAGEMAALWCQAPWRFWGWSLTRTLSAPAATVQQYSGARSLSRDLLQCVEACLLLGGQAGVEVVQRRLHLVGRLQHGRKPLLHRLQSSDRRNRHLVGARRLQYGLVTCHHCLGPGLKISLPSDPTKTFPVSTIKSNSHIDLAILSTPTALANIIPISASSGASLPNGTALTLYGYPGHHAAKPIRVESGSLIRSFPRSAVSYLEITPKIIGGNSGGPVLNDKHEVVGVAVMGLNGKVELKTTEFLAVSIAEVAKL